MPFNQPLCHLLSCKGLTILLALLSLLACETPKTEPYQDVSFYSDAFATERNYRIYLPGDYAEQADKQYPVVYYFHGYGGRYKWDAYDLGDDVHYPENGRLEPPFVMEWKKYAQENNLIIVTWDGYEPNLSPGKKEREGIPYGNALPYDYVRAHETEREHWGWDFSAHFRELVKHVDQNFRSIPDRSKRAITGLSMGGLTSYYVAGQNKDLVASVSAFDPAANLPYYGPKGRQVVFPVLEMHRSLKGLAVRLTKTDGDWLKYNNWHMTQLFGSADLSHFETHTADYPNHWAADTEQQLDFHRNEFAKTPALPAKWNHVNPGFDNFEVFGNTFEIKRETPALTLIENASANKLKILSRTFIPDGPIVLEESIAVNTAGVYAPGEAYLLRSFNLSTHAFEEDNLVAADKEGKLDFALSGGGHWLGINREAEPKAQLGMVFPNNQEHFYFEEGNTESLSFSLVNIGNAPAQEIEIIPLSQHPHLKISPEKITISALEAKEAIDSEQAFQFTFGRYSDSSFVAGVDFVIRADQQVTDTLRIMAFAAPKAVYSPREDLILLDGRTVPEVPIYQQGMDTIVFETLSGGEGNGNGIWEAGEEVLFYLRLPQGLAPKDTNTFHSTYLLNHPAQPYAHVNSMHYLERLNQASCTSETTPITLSPDSPKNQELDLWLRAESLYNDKNDSTSNATIYANQFHFRRVKVGR
ncbi:alpha/beta hydrolase-fold protein [Cyclobacterium amurskyense]|uniref:alpha/beta hydrolase-fold protein n=1 Tax=Cyclobacterium amurskyense TaxID=320787 RepID=UPI0030D7FC8A